MGGGGFWMEPENPLLDEYVLAASGLSRPRICFIPTACGDASHRIEQFYAAFNALPCRPAHLSLFRDPAGRSDLIKGSDILYVGGGNTRFMLAIWKACGLDRMLREAWEAGTLLCGLSAGAICWFAEGLTDSDGPLGPMDCLGFLPGACVPHYDGERDRRPAFHRFLKSGEIGEGLALDDGVAAHYVGKELKELVSSRASAGAYSVACRDGETREEALPVTCLGKKG